MKNYLFVVIIFISFNSITYCQTLNDEQIYNALREKYGFSNLALDVNQENNLQLSNLIKNDQFITKNIGDILDLNLADVNITIWNDGRTSYIIKFKTDVNKVLIVTVKNNDYSLPLNTSIIVNNVDKIGNGTIKVKTNFEEFMGVFRNGTNFSEPVEKKSCFRGCFDGAYDDICDGFIGCVAWYTNPAVAYIAACYCAGYC